jgi:hypothetical protein
MDDSEPSTAKESEDGRVAPAQRWYVFRALAYVVFTWFVGILGVLTPSQSIVQALALAPLLVAICYLRRPRIIVTCIMTTLLSVPIAFYPNGVYEALYVCFFGYYPSGGRGHV